jgi:hypothetical protein
MTLSERVENYKRYKNEFAVVDKVGSRICSKLNSFQNTPEAAYEFKMLLCGAIDDSPVSGIILLRHVIGGSDFPDWIVSGARYSCFGVPMLPKFWNQDEMNTVLNDAISIYMLGGDQ